MFWLPRSFLFLLSLRELPIHTILGTQPERREQHRKEFLDAIWKEADIRIDEAALARAVGEAKAQQQAQAKQR